MMDKCLFRAFEKGAKQILSHIILVTFVAVAADLATQHEMVNKAVP